MDRIEEKIESTLKTIIEVPPDTLTNMVMSKVRSPRKKPAMLWIGIASTLACAAAVTVMVTTNGFGNLNQETPSAMLADSDKAADTASSYAAKAAPPQTGGASQEQSESTNPNLGSESKPGETAAIERTASKKDESRPATKEEIDELSRPIGKTLQTEANNLLQVSVVSSSINPEATWSIVRDKSMVFSSMVSSQIIGDKNTPAAKKIYKLQVILSRSYFASWAEMVKKYAGKITGMLAIPKDGDSFNVTVTFEAAK